MAIFPCSAPLLVLVSSLSILCPPCLAERPHLQSEVVPRRVRDVAVGSADQQDDTALAFDGRGLSAFTRIAKRLPAIATASLVQLHSHEAVSSECTDAQSAQHCKTCSDASTCTECKDARFLCVADACKDHKGSCVDFCPEATKEKDVGDGAHASCQDDPEKTVATETKAAVATEEKAAVATKKKGAKESGATDNKLPPPVATIATLQKEYKEAIESGVKTVPQEKDYLPTSIKEMTEKQLLGATPGWAEFHDGTEKHRKASEEHWKKQLQSVSEKRGLGGQYTDFMAKVLAVDPGKNMLSLNADAKNAVDANHVANQDAYEYIDDLGKLADGTAVGYNRMGVDHFYAHDQIQAQLEEGHMAPGKSIRLLFPLAGTVGFVGNSHEQLLPETERYLQGAFADQVGAKLQKYRGMHFTVCIHASTNLDPNQVPLNYETKSDRQMETLEDGTKVTVGIKRMLDGRGKTLESEIEKILTGKFKARGEEFHFPPPTVDTRHTSKEMPAGAVLIIAEDRLHRDEFKASGNTTEELAASQAAHDQELKDIAKYDQTKCKVDDFEKLKANAGLTEEIIKAAPFFNLPRSTQQENNQETNSRRLTPEEAEKRAAELEGASKLKESYTEGRAEAAKYVEAIKNIHGGAEYGEAKNLEQAESRREDRVPLETRSEDLEQAESRREDRGPIETRSEALEQAENRREDRGPIESRSEDAGPIETDSLKAAVKRQADEACAEVLDAQCGGLQSMQSFKAKGKMHSVPDDYKCVRMYKCVEIGEEGSSSEDFGLVASEDDCKKEKTGLATDRRAVKVCAAQKKQVVSARL